MLITKYLTIEDSVYENVYATYLLLDEDIESDSCSINELDNRYLIVQISKETEEEINDEAACICYSLISAGLTNFKYRLSYSSEDYYDD